MVDRRSIDAVLADVDRLIQVMTENSTLTVGDLTLEVVKAAAIRLRSLKQSRDEMRVSLTKVVDDTNDQAKLVNSYVTRGRSAIKGIFGPDSAQYDQMRGTRASERKPRSTKKSKTP